ncbi:MULTISPECIES: hypothetical protein [Oceanobacillus]|uniref:hypothetical protein n=1 Tax=Oceanobacillus TaxID=182709 RepID=UPI002115F29F|nr:hypothetical protein [Oceanobacillus oncorhynchi]UUI41811.1 hypothetical protein NP440_09930 [Oceanobacillus oncorhynchi]
MSTEVTLVTAIISIVIWSAVSWELTKSSKEQNRKRITLLMSAGCLSTLILMVPLFETISF